MLKNLIKLLLTGTLITLTTLNGLYNPKTILIMAFFIILISIKEFNKKTKNYNITTLNIYLILTLFLSKYSNLGMNEILMLVTSFSIINLKDYFLKERKFIAKILVFLCFAQLILSIDQIFIKEGIRSFGLFKDSYNSKIFFPNAFALFNLIALGFSNSLSKNFQKLALTISFFNIFLSQSRGGLIAFFIILIGHLILASKSKINLKKLLKNSLIVILVLIGTFFISNKQEKKLNLNFEGTSKLTSINERLETFNYGLNEILKNPFTINGSNSFQEFSKKYQTRWLANAPHPHNFLVKYWSELGIIFTVLFSIFCFNVVKNLSLNPNKKEFLDSISIIAIIFHNSIDYNLNFTINIFLFFILLSYYYKERQRGYKKHNVLIINTVLIIILSLSYAFNYQNLRNIRDMSEISFQNLNFENSVLMQLQKANLENLIIPNENLNYFINYSENLYLNNFELAKYFLNKDKSKSQNFINKAINLNPRNNWDFYKFAIENKIQTSKDIIKELENYLPLAQSNIHYTSNSKNIDSAIEVCKLIQANICMQLIDAKEKFKKKN